MKRKLREKLVLLVKQQGSALNGSKQGWAFPHVQHREGETIRSAAERALRECAGVAEAFFIGNAPMAHHPLGGGASASASSSSSGGGGASSSGAAAAGSASAARALHTSSSPAAAASSAAGPSQEGSGSKDEDTMFFMLAQVVNDPWELQLREGFASEHAWVTVEELPQYLNDERLVDLTRQML